MTRMEDKLAGALLAMLKGSNMKGYFAGPDGDAVKAEAEKVLSEYKAKKQYTGPVEICNLTGD